MFLKLYLFIFVLGLRCCAGLFSLVEASGGCCLDMVCRLLTVGSPAVRHRLWGEWASAAVARRLRSASSTLVVHGLRCSTACGIFPEQVSVSPALVGGFSTTGPPGKPLLLF